MNIIKIYQHRVLFDKWSGQDYINLFREPRRAEDLARTIVKAITKYGFDGIVLEVWSQLGGQAKPQLISVIKTISQAVRDRDKAFILVIPPPIYAGDQVWLQIKPFGCYFVSALIPLHLKSPRWRSQSHILVKVILYT